MGELLGELRKADWTIFKVEAIARQRARVGVAVQSTEIRLEMCRASKQECGLRSGLESSQLLPVLRDVVR